MLIHRPALVLACCVSTVTLVVGCGGGSRNDGLLDSENTEMGGITVPEVSSISNLQVIESANSPTEKANAFTVTAIPSVSTSETVVTNPPSPALEAPDSPNTPAAPITQSASAPFVTTATDTESLATIAATRGTGKATPTLATKDLLATIPTAQTRPGLDWMWAVECAGQTLAGPSVPATGMRATDAGDERRDLRFGAVADPLQVSRGALFTRVTATDTLIHGGSRCEISASPTAGAQLPWNQPFWFATAIYMPTVSSSSKDETILAQWHSSAGSTPLNPFMALSIRGGVLQVVVRNNPNTPIAKETTSSASYLLPGAVIPNQWRYLSFRARLSSNPSDRPFLQVWSDGRLVVDHQGPIGYVAAPTRYLKLGLYHWIGAANPWPTNQVAKTALFKPPVLAIDSAGYAESLVRSTVATK